MNKRNKRIISVIAIIMALLMLIGLVVSVLPVRAYADDDDDVESIQEQIDTLQGQKDELAGKSEKSREKLERLREEQSALIEQKAALEERASFITEQMRLTDEQISLYRGLIEKKQEEVDAARELELRQLERYRTRVRAMEENGGLDVLALLLNVRSFSDLLSAIEDIRDIMKSDKRLEDDYIAAREEHERVKAEYEAEKAKYEDKMSELESEQEALEQEIEESEALILELAEEIETTEAEYEAAMAAEAAAASSILYFIVQLNAAQQAASQPKPAEQPSQPDPGDAPAQEPTEQPAEQPSQPDPGDAPAQQPAEQPAEQPSQPDPGDTPAQQPTEQPAGQPSQPDPGDTPAQQPAEQPSQPDPGDTVAQEPGPGDPGYQQPSVGAATGTLIWPVPGCYSVSSPYGYRTDPFTGQTRYHSGMDIDGYGHDGGAIVACDGGTVVAAAYSDGYGNYIIIDHGNGVQTLYAHMSGFAVGYGSVVSQGQTIGYLGMTGRATGVHCHLEVFINKERVDPAGYVG